MVLVLPVIPEEEVDAIIEIPVLVIGSKTGSLFL